MIEMTEVKETESESRVGKNREISIPKKNRTHLYLILSIIFSLITIYVAILTNKLAIAALIIIPFIFLLRRNKVN